MRTFVGCVLLVLNSAAPSPPNYGGCNIFPGNAMWNTKVSDLPVHAMSTTYLSSFATTHLHLDLGKNLDMTSDEYYGIPFNLADGSKAWTSITFDSGGGYDYESDCASGPSHTIHSPCRTTGGQPYPDLQIPLPANPLVESGLATGPDDADHHLLVVDTANCVLWEVYNTYKPSGWMTTGAICRWDMKTNNLRPAGWTSSDAAGLPVMPLLLRQDEAANGPINHGFRFTLQKANIQGPSSVWEWPASHNTGGGTTSKPKMGQIFRLKASVTIPATWSAQSKAIAQAFKDYGIYLADIGSNGYIQGEPNANWDDKIFDEIQTLTMGQFEAVDISSIKSAAGWNVSSAARPGASTGPTNAPGTPSLAPTNKAPSKAPTMDPCLALNNCSGHGVCNEGVCACTGGYTGTKCDIIPNCPAGMGWSSTAPGTNATKPCPAGQTGTDTRPCKADGTWGVEINTCVYPPNCTDKIQNQDETGVDCGGTRCPACLKCPTINCGAHGVCIEGANATCQCNGGYTGDRCQTPPDPCLNKTCGAHGVCDSATGLCNCTGGYSGALCQSPPAATCSDGTMNQNETGIDCGGICPPCPMFTWEVTNWTTCTVTCGGGTQTRIATCMSGGTVVAPSNCASLHPVPTAQICNPDICPTYTWQTGAFGDCTSPCGSGVQTRTVTCFSSQGNVTVTPGPNTCPVGIMPASSQTCNTQACTANHWRALPWSACTRTCGGGTQTRDVNCLNAAESMMLPEGMCTDPKPPKSQACNIVSCTVYGWSPCPQWSSCSASCGGGDGMLGQQWRDVFCTDGMGNVVDSSLCNNATKPASTVDICNTQKCTKLNWMVTAPGWGPCVNGQRTRAFHCHTADGGNALMSDCTTALGETPLTTISCKPNTCLVTSCPDAAIALVFDACGADDLAGLCTSACTDAVKSLSTAFTGVSSDVVEVCLEAYNGVPKAGVSSMALAQLFARGKFCPTASSASTLYWGLPVLLLTALA